VGFHRRVQGESRNPRQRCSQSLKRESFKAERHRGPRAPSIARAEVRSSKGRSRDRLALGRKHDGFTKKVDAPSPGGQNTRRGKKPSLRGQTPCIRGKGRCDGSLQAGKGCHESSDGKKGESRLRRGTFYKTRKLSRSDGTGLEEFQRLREKDRQKLPTRPSPTGIRERDSRKRLGGGLVYTVADHVLVGQSRKTQGTVSGGREAFQGPNGGEGEVDVIGCQVAPKAPKRIV